MLPLPFMQPEIIKVIYLLGERMALGRANPRVRPRGKTNLKLLTPVLLTGFLCRLPSPTPPTPSRPPTTPGPDLWGQRAHPGSLKTTAMTPSLLVFLVMGEGG